MLFRTSKSRSTMRSRVCRGANQRASNWICSRRQRSRRLTQLHLMNAAPAQLRSQSRHSRPPRAKPRHSTSVSTRPASLPSSALAKTPTTRAQSSQPIDSTNLPRTSDSTASCRYQDAFRDRLLPQPEDHSTTRTTRDAAGADSDRHSFETRPGDRAVEREGEQPALAAGRARGQAAEKPPARTRKRVGSPHRVKGSLAPGCARP